MGMLINAHQCVVCSPGLAAGAMSDHGGTCDRSALRRSRWLRAAVPARVGGRRRCHRFSFSYESAYASRSATNGQSAVAWRRLWGNRKTGNDAHNSI